MKKTLQGLYADKQGELEVVWQDSGGEYSSRVVKWPHRMNNRFVGYAARKINVEDEKSYTFSLDDFFIEPAMLEELSIGHK